MAALLLLALGGSRLRGDAALQDAPRTVSGVIAVAAKAGDTIDRGGVAIWLTPAAGAARDGRSGPSARSHFKIVQQDKRFSPRVLVVPVGSTVEFPNLDPFFHNVFSLFDGKRFDLGLYEAGTSRSVNFPRPGVCYVFCNIHPDMSAVVVVVDSTYYATSSRTGEFSIADVPTGRYALSVWHDRFTPESPGEYPKDIVVSEGGASLGSIRLVDRAQILSTHKNKFGNDYVPPGPTNPYR